MDYELPIVWLHELGQKARIYGDLRAGLRNSAGRRNFFFSGLAFESDLSPRWTLTGEIYGNSGEERGESGTPGFNLGFIYKLRSGAKSDPEGRGRTCSSPPGAPSREERT